MLVELFLVGNGFGEWGFDEVVYVFNGERIRFIGSGRLVLGIDIGTLFIKIYGTIITGKFKAVRSILAMWIFIIIKHIGLHSPLFNSSY